MEKKESVPWPSAYQGEDQMDPWNQGQLGYHKEETLLSQLAAAAFCKR